VLAFVVVVVVLVVVFGFVFASVMRITSIRV